MRNDIAGALQRDGIANAHILAGDFIFIMQSRVAHHHATDIDRFHHGTRRQRTSTADLDFNIKKLGHRLFGGEFPRHRPARCAADKAKAALPINAVKLIDHAINIIRQSGTARADFGLEGFRHIFAFQPARQWVHRKTPAAQFIQESVMRFRRRFARGPHGIGQQFQRACRGNARI